MSGPRGRRWLAVGAGALATAALAAYALTAAPPDHPSEAGGTPDTVTYEVTGPAEVDTIRYGDVFDLIYSPYVATTVSDAPLPWRVTVPLSGALSLHDLAARSDDPSAPVITCTVRRGGVVVSTQTGLGEVGCDATPASAP